MQASPFDTLTRALALGERTRRDTLRLLVGAGTSLATLAVFADARAKKRHHKKHKRKKKHFKGDSRCKGRDVISSNGICIDLEDQAQVALATCSAIQGCLCATDANGAPACVVGGGPACVTTCLSDDDCDPGTRCVEVAGCCGGDPELARTCAVPCPPL
jgi:hypothetical protein